MEVEKTFKILQKDKPEDIVLKPFDKSKGEEQGNICTVEKLEKPSGELKETWRWGIGKRKTEKEDTKKKKRIKNKS